MVDFCGHYYAIKFFSHNTYSSCTMAYPPPSYTINDKRQRTVTTRAAKRPIDKVMTIVNQAGVDSTDVTTTITTCTYPCTITGLRWGLSFNQFGGSATCHYVWAIIYLREGETIDGLSFADGLTFYKPESSVLVWGYGAMRNLQTTNYAEGTTKTMRKMQLGDSVQFIMRGITTEESEVRGCVQLFLKG